METTVLTDSGYRIEIDHDKLQVRFGAGDGRSSRPSPGKLNFTNTEAGPVFVNATAFWGIPDPVREALKTVNIYFPENE